MEIKQEHQDTRKRLENIAFEDISQKGKIITNLGEELIIDIHRSEKAEYLFIKTIIEKENGDLIESRYYHVDKDKNGNVYVKTLVKGSAEYKYTMKRKKELGLK